MNRPVQRSRIARPLIRTAASTSSPHAITSSTRGPISENGPKIDASVAALGIIPPPPLLLPSFCWVATAGQAPALAFARAGFAEASLAEAGLGIQRDHPAKRCEWRAAQKPRGGTTPHNPLAC